MFVSAVAGCAASRSGGAAPAAPAELVLVYLQSGPTSGRGTKEERERLFAGHMANINRLAAERKLLIAGPFNRPRDKTWRGLFLFDVAATAEAETIAGTDPGVIAGEFVAVAKRVRGSPVLRQTLALEDEWQAARRADPSSPPASIKPYVMLTTTDVGRARRAIERLKPSPRVVWGVLFADEPGGVLVLDAEQAGAIGEQLAAIDAGAGAVDGWFSTVALTKLPADAAR